MKKVIDWKLKNGKKLTPKEAVCKLKQNNVDGSHLFDDELLDIVEKAINNYEMIKCGIDAVFVALSKEHYSKPEYALDDIREIMNDIKKD